MIYAPVMVIILHRWKLLEKKNSTFTGIGNFGPFGTLYEHIAFTRDPSRNEQLQFQTNCTKSMEARQIASITVYKRLTVCHISKHFITILTFKLAVKIHYRTSNTFGTIKLCSRHGWFELNHSVRSGGII